MEKEKKRRRRKKRLCSIFLLLILLLTASCGRNKNRKDSELTLSSFGDATENHHMQCVEQDPDQTKGMTRWVVAQQEKATGTIQYIEFTDASEAKSFLDNQRDYIEKATGHTGAAGSSYWTMSQDGFYYYMGYHDNKFILATAQLGDDADNVRAALEEMPQIQGDF